MSLPDWSSFDLNPEDAETSPESGHDPDGVPLSLIRQCPGELVWNDSGKVYVHTTVYDLTASVGSLSFTHHGGIGLDALKDPFLPNLDLQDRTLHDCAFLDCETTGLGRNALPFMVGVATYERMENLQDYDPVPNPDGSFALRRLTMEPVKTREGEPPSHFVVRQLLALRPEDESAVLQATAQLVASRGVCVTFNGNGFDLPLMQARFAYHAFYFPELPLVDPVAGKDFRSVDLLPMARRLWRMRIGSCALTNCEARVLGLRRTRADVEGARIPGIYMQFLETGSVTDLSRVFYHNRQDIVSMAFLLERIVDALKPKDLERHPGEDALALALLWESQGDHAKSVPGLHQAVQTLSGHALQPKAFAALAIYYKRRKRWTEAVSIWEQWIGTAAQDTPEPYIELAKYHEWQAKDLEQAEMYTRWAMHVLQTTRPFHDRQSAEVKMAHRLRRIQRKRTRDLEPDAGQ